MLKLNKEQATRAYDYLYNASIVIEKRLDGNDWVTVTSESALEIAADWSFVETIAYIAPRVVALPLTVFLEIFLSPTEMGNGSLPQEFVQPTRPFMINGPQLMPILFPAGKPLAAPMNVGIATMSNKPLEPVKEISSAPKKIVQPSACMKTANLSLTREKNQNAIYSNKNRFPEKTITSSTLAQNSNSYVDHKKYNNNSDQILINADSNKNQPSSTPIQPHHQIYTSQQLSHIKVEKIMQQVQALHKDMLNQRAEMKNQQIQAQTLANFKGIEAGFGLIQQIGCETGSKGLQMFATAGVAVTQGMLGFAQLTGTMGMAAVTGLSMITPVTALIGGMLSLGSLLSRGKSNKQAKALQKQFRALAT